MWELSPLEYSLETLYLVKLPLLYAFQKEGSKYIIYFVVNLTHNTGFTQVKGDHKQDLLEPVSSCSAMEDTCKFKNYKELFNVGIWEIMLLIFSPQFSIT